MAPRYARVPNPTSTHDDLEGELEAAFELDDEDEPVLDRRQAPQRSQALSINTTTSAGQGPTVHQGGYDFERQDYDFPPPGSPPAPSSRALPNTIGNSNGVLPSSPTFPQPPQPSFFRRAVGALLPSHYTQVPTSESSRRVGGGTENDGVFANVMAKPQAGRVVQTEDGNAYVVPEDSQKEMPPTYAEAQADAVPPYWETTVHAPATLLPGADMIIDDLPTGTFIVFALNFLISWFFQFVGFFLTYMLHTSHAAKFGSRAGLGLTLIQYGFYSRRQAPGGGGRAEHRLQEMNRMSQTAKDWLCRWFLLLSSCVGYWRVKRWEASLRAPPPPDPTTAD
ncbi:metal homeostatis protein bsd2 [Ephemerocybe angulata]|uniref:Metal homeostatis protein bsd2 n=1 Tax=Ephemerocybe angulata TaxID=980116 RepID=A0A8H6I1L2_9AGAR|nr:metal homeostatis protein bsd2 [Tulosesus angulatus]